MPKKKEFTIEVARSAITGRFIKKSYAKKHPKNTVIETIKRRNK
jgi:hypothetical protein